MFAASGNTRDTPRVYGVLCLLEKRVEAAKYAVDGGAVTRMLLPALDNGRVVAKGLEVRAGRVERNDGANE